MHTGKLRGAYRESDSSLVYAHEYMYGLRAAVSAWSCQLEGHVRPPHGPEARATAHLKMHHAPWGDEHESTCPQRQIRTSPAPSASGLVCAGAASLQASIPEHDTCCFTNLPTASLAPCEAHHTVHRNRSNHNLKERLSFHV